MSKGPSIPLAISLAQMTSEPGGKSCLAYVIREKWSQIVEFTEEWLASTPFRALRIELGSSERFRHRF